MTIKNKFGNIENSSLENTKGAFIVGLGEILWDVFPEGKILGGAPANFAYHASQFGFEGCALSAIGNDELGSQILQTLENKKLRHALQTVDFPTGKVKVSVDEKGVPQYEICENVAWDNIPFSAELENLAKRTQTVCFGSLAQRNAVSRKTIRRFLDALPSSALKIFDINLRQYFYSLEIIEDSLMHANILKINDEEVVIVSKLLHWETKSELEICTLLLKNYDLDMIVLTKGTQGSYVITPNESSFQPTPMVEVADTVGAGDSFTAGFVSALLSGKSIREAHRLAVDVSAFVCTQHGAMPVLPENLLIRIK